MPPRTKRLSVKNQRVTRENYTPPPHHNAPPSYPWPRQEAIPIILEDPQLLDFNCEGWDKEAAETYNTLLRTEFRPTSFGHAEAIAELRLDTEVFDTLQAMGIAPFCYKAHELYPDLVRQILATAVVGYEDPSRPTYKNCSFSFMADGKFCKISLDKINEIYELDDDPKGVVVERKFTPQNAFWNFIAAGNFMSRSAYQSQIRNPTLRVIAKMLSNLLFAKEDTSKVQNGELQMIYTGVVDEIRRADVGIPFQQVWTNPGFHLISMIENRRTMLCRTAKKKDRCGSLLTPLLKHFQIDLSKYRVVPDLEFVDMPYLIGCHILCD